MKDGNIQYSYLNHNQIRYIPYTYTHQWPLMILRKNKITICAINMLSKGNDIQTVYKETYTK